MRPLSKFEHALHAVREAPVLAFDVETSGLDWKRNFPAGYVVATPERSVYIPIRHGGGGNLPDPNMSIPESSEAPTVLHWFEVELAAAFAARSRDATKVTVGHNIKFDAHFAANAGVLLGRHLSDTQNNEALLDEYARGYTLAECCDRAGVTAKKGDDMYAHLAQKLGVPASKNLMGRFWELPGNDPMVVAYAEGDGTSTLELYEAQLLELSYQNLDAVYDIECRLIWTLYRMERRGVPVHRAYLEWLLGYVEDQVTQAYADLPKGFNPRSPVDVRRICETAGRTDWPRTEKGNPSFSEGFLSSFAEGWRVVKVRKWTNLANSFVRPLLEQHVHQDRVHATFNQLKNDDYGTPARLSCSRPNLQQVPKRDKVLARLFRTGFIAQEGFRFYEGDWSQCEPRMFAHYSNEPALIEGYRQVPPRDMHQVVADMLGVERDPTAKRMNMGILTGMYPSAFAGHMGWDLATAAEKWERWFEAFPAIRNFQETATATLRSRGYVRTLLGRRGRLEHPRFAYRAVSKIIQGGNADIIKTKLVELDEWLEKEGDPAYLALTVHDSIGWQAPDSPEGHGISAHIASHMAEVQQPPFNLRVPFEVDVDSGRSWAQASFGSDCLNDMGDA